MKKKRIIDQIFRLKTTLLVVLISLLSTNCTIKSYGESLTGKWYLIEWSDADRIDHFSDEEHYLEFYEDGYWIGQLPNGEAKGIWTKEIEENGWILEVQNGEMIVLNIENEQLIGEINYHGKKIRIVYEKK
jgi:hypothetical protein